MHAGLAVVVEAQLRSGSCGAAAQVPDGIPLSSQALVTNTGTGFAANAKHLGQDLTRNPKAEIAHVTDPAQCGNIVRRHFGGIVIALYVFIFLFLQLRSSRSICTHTTRMVFAWDHPLPLLSCEKASRLSGEPA